MLMLFRNIVIIVLLMVYLLMMKLTLMLFIDAVVVNLMVSPIKLVKAAIVFVVER